MKTIKIIVYFVALIFISNVYGQEDEFLAGTITEPEYVYSLHLYEKGLKELPDNFSLLTELEYLYLDNNQLNQLPPSIKNVSKLLSLSLIENKFTTFPKEILEMKNLTHLDLSGNIIQSIPKEIGTLKQLQFLLLSETGISSLPESICNLTQLELLAVSSNQLKSLPSCLKNFPKLENLYIGENAFTSFPMIVTELVQLKSLDIEQKNQFEIPDEIKNLKKLEYLYIDKDYYKNNKSRLKKLLPKGCKVNEMPPPPPPPQIEVIEDINPSPPIVSLEVYSEQNCFNFTEKIKKGEIVTESLYTLDFSGSNVYTKLVKESSEYSEKDQLEAEKEGYTIVSLMDMEISDGKSEIKNGNLIFTPEGGSEVKTFKIKYKKDGKTIKELIDSNKQTWKQGECYAAPPSIGF